MMPMVNMTTRRTDRDVLDIIKQTIATDEAITIDRMAERLDCERKTVIRSISRLERLQLIIVNRTLKPSRYQIVK